MTRRKIAGTGIWSSACIGNPPRRGDTATLGLIDAGGDCLCDVVGSAERDQVVAAELHDIDGVVREVQDVAGRGLAVLVAEHDGRRSSRGGDPCGQWVVLKQCVESVAAGGPGVLDAVASDVGWNAAHRAGENRGERAAQEEHERAREARDRGVLDGLSCEPVAAGEAFACPRGVAEARATATAHPYE